MHAIVGEKGQFFLVGEFYLSTAPISKSGPSENYDLDNRKDHKQKPRRATHRFDDVVLRPWNHHNVDFGSI